MTAEASHTVMRGATVLRGAATLVPMAPVVVVETTVVCGAVVCSSMRPSRSLHRSSAVSPPRTGALANLTVRGEGIGGPAGDRAIAERGSTRAELGTIFTRVRGVGTLHRGGYGQVTMECAN
jgi:hypothetical protein